MIKIAVIGFGNIGGGLVELIVSNKKLIAKDCGTDVEIKYIVDIRDFSGHPLENKIVKDFNIVLNDPEVSIVAEMIGGSHPAFDFSIAALRAGKHVLMEKPAGICAYQTHSLERIAKKNGKIAAVAMNRRHIPLIQEVLKRFEGEKITEIDGRFMKYSDIGSCWHYASAYNCDIVHIIDLIRYVAGSEVTNAATLISKNDSSVDNAWSSVMRFENGIAGTLRANYQSSGRFHDIEIHGPRVSAIVSLGMGDMKCWAKIHYTTGRTIYSAASAGVTVGNYEYLDGEEIANSSVYADYYGYKAENVDFVNAVLNGTQPLATIEDAAKTMDLLEYLLEKKI